MRRIFQLYIPPVVSALLLLEFLALMGCFVAAAWFVLIEDPELYLFEENRIWAIVLVVVTLMLALYFQDMYSSLRVQSRTLLFQQICTAVGVAFLGQSMQYYVSQELTVPRRVMLTGGLLSLAVVFLLRLLYSGSVVGSFGVKRLLFVGRSQTVVKIAQRIQEHPELGMMVLGFVGEDGPPGSPPSLGPVEDLRRLSQELAPDKIVIGMTERRERLPMYTLLDLKFGGTVIEEAATTFEATHHRVSVKDLRPSDLVFSSQPGDMRMLTNLQNLYSRVLALIGFVLTLPLMVLVWVLVKVTSPGPGFYSQVRSGLNGKPFRVLKFRSMRTDAEAATGAVWATKNDPRITPIGKWLRLLRLDELPQFVNVLRGEMNIVGPRPERPEFVQTLQTQIPFYRHRLFVKPGLTGWAQINHKYGDTIEDTVTKLEYDLHYIKNRSISLDAYIMVQTVKVMLLHRGAQ